MTHRRLFLIGAYAASLPVLARAQVSTAVPQQTNVIDALAAAGNYDNFIELVSRAGAVDQLRGAGPFTLLALNNAAMANLPGTLRDTLDPTVSGSGAQRQQDPDRVRFAAFVNMHIIEGHHMPFELSERVTMLRTRNGNMVEINAAQPDRATFRIVGDSGFGVGGLNVAAAPVTLAAAAIPCSNGVVLPISAPLIQ